MTLKNLSNLQILELNPTRIAIMQVKLLKYQEKEKVSEYVNTLIQDIMRAFG